MALDRHEHSQLNEAKDAAGRAQRQGTEIKDEIRLLRNKVSALSVACQALWELLRDRTKLTEEDIVEKIASLEGKMGESLTCPQCGRAVSRKKNETCLFCGVKAKSEHLFDV